MGVSLQVYRSRIGTFLSKGIKTQNTKLKVGNKSNSYFRKCLAILLLLSSLASVLHIIQQEPHVHPGLLHQPKQGGVVHLVPDTQNLHLDRPCRLTSRDRNFLAKMVNGNRGARGAGIKLVHWNKGSSFLHNKHQEIETIIAGHHPHVLGLSEANLRNDHDLALVQHPDYDLHLSPTSSNPELNISRVVVYCGIYTQGSGGEEEDRSRG